MVHVQYVEPAANDPVNARLEFLNDAVDGFNDAGKVTDAQAKGLFKHARKVTDAQAKGLFKHANFARLLEFRENLSCTFEYIINEYLKFRRFRYRFERTERRMESPKWILITFVQVSEILYKKL
jgi:hypothetical protein